MMDLKTKMETVKELLKDTLEKVKALELEDAASNKASKTSKYSARVSIKLSEILRKYPVRTYNEALALSYEAIQEHFFAFMELMSWINEYCLLPPNKQHFCALLQITNNQYLALLEGQNPEIVSLMESIEDYIVGETFTASQSGEVKEVSTMTRLKAKGQGHSIQENKGIDTVVINNKLQITESDMLKRLEQITKKQLKSG